MSYYKIKYTISHFLTVQIKTKRESFMVFLGDISGEICNKLK